MKQVIGFSIMLCWLAGETFAQKYSTTLGVRLSKGNYGVTAKQRVFRSFSVEGIVSGNDRELTGTLLVEKHFPLIGKGLNAYIGGGAHLGGLQGYGPVAGADALIGAELKVPFLPLVVSADVKPAYQVMHEERFNLNSAVSVRYIIGKESKKKREKTRERRKRRKERDKEKRQWQKEREKRRKEKAKEKEKKAKGKDRRNKEEEDTKLFENVHLLRIFRNEEEEPQKKR